VFERCRALIVSLEDDAEELKRRILAACIRHGVDISELKGWLFLAAPGARAGKLMILDAKGRPARGTLIAALEAAIIRHKIDLIALDPFIKAHGVTENDNNLIDQVAQLLADLAAKHNIAVDIPHHVRKGAADPGNSDRGRGASAARDAARLVYSLTTMTSDEASAFSVPEDQRRSYIRMDSAKVNIAPPMTKAKWFKLVGVPLGNATELYPNGDEVQTVETWSPPRTWDGSTLEPSTASSTPSTPV
jgi:RecA-family ATPase